MTFYIQFTDWSVVQIPNYSLTPNVTSAEATKIDGIVDANTVNGADNNSGNINITAGQTVGLRGWIGYSAAITNYGYYFDGNASAVQWTSNANTDMSDAETIQVLGGQYAERYHVQASTSDLSTADHTVTYILKLSDGTTRDLGTLNFTVSKNSSGIDSDSTVPDTPATNGEPTYTINFNTYTNDPVSSFGITNINNVSVGANTANGYLTFTAIGTDPYTGLATPNAPVMSDMDYVLIKYRTSATDNFQFYCGNGWGNTVASSWSKPYRNYTSEWKFALVDASSAWGSSAEQMNSFRFDMMSDGANDATNFNGTTIDVSNIYFFATQADAVLFIEQEETKTTTTIPGDLQTWPSSNVLQTGADAYTYYESIVGLSNIVATSPYAGNGDCKHCFDGWVGINSAGAYTNVEAAVFQGWKDVSLGDGNYWTQMGFRGWVNPSNCDAGETSYDAVIARVGYQINNNAIVWIDGATTVSDHTGTGTTTTAVWSDSELITYLGAANARRYMIWVPTSEFDYTRNNQLFLYAELTNGTVLYLNNTIYSTADGCPYQNDPSKGVYVSSSASGLNNYIYKDANGTYYSNTPTGYTKSYTGSEYIVSGNTFAVTKNSDGTFTTGTASSTVTTYSVETPTAASAPKLRGAGVALGDTLTLRVYATIPDVTTNNWAVRFIMNDVTTLVPLSAAQASGTSNQYIFSFTNILPQGMGDTIDIALVSYDTATNAVLSIYDTKDAYNVKQSLVNTMNNNSGDAKLVQLIHDLLTYGATAQLYTGYKTDALVTDGLSLNPSIAVPGAADKAQFSIAPTTGNAYFVSAAVQFDAGYNRLVFTYCTNGAQDVTFRFNGVVAQAEWNETAGAYLVHSENLTALDNDKLYTVELYEGDTCVQTLTYSVNAYAYRISDNVKADGTPTLGAQLALALYRYGLSAEAYANQ